MREFMVVLREFTVVLRGSSTVLGAMIFTLLAGFAAWRSFPRQSIRMPPSIVICDWAIARSVAARLVAAAG
jgi:hypothetical protein